MNARIRIPVGPNGNDDFSTRTRDQWLVRFHHSGLTQEAFARVHGLKLSRLRYWLYGDFPSERAGSPSPRWQEVGVTHRFDGSGWGAEVCLPDGRVIRLEAALARELVRPLLA